MPVPKQNEGARFEATPGEPAARSSACRWNCGPSGTGEAAPAGAARARELSEVLERLPCGEHGAPRGTDTASLRSAGQPTGALLLRVPRRQPPPLPLPPPPWGNGDDDTASLETGVQEADFQPAGTAPSKGRNLS